jgi:hypothetical protein
MNISGKGGRSELAWKDSEKEVTEGNCTYREARYTMLTEGEY